MRKYGLLLSSLLVLAIFFGGFFLYYVPGNREAQNKYGFLILQTIQSNLESKIGANLIIYRNNLHNASSISHLSSTSKSFHVEIKKINDSGCAAIDTHLSDGQFDDILDDNIMYSFCKCDTALNVSVSIYDVFDAITPKYKNDFYQHFLFLKINRDTECTPIYRSENLNLGDDISIESLLPASKNGFYPGIADVSLGDSKYKMFYTPVALNSKAFVLCGFKDAQEYQQNLNRVPTKFIFPIAIILFLLLIILPLIKLYIMGPGEKISIWDFAGFGFSLFIGAMFVTNVIIQVVLLKEGDLKTSNNLRSLSKQIDSSFHEELLQAYHQIEEVDSLSETVNKDSPNYSLPLIKSLQKRPHPDSGYYYNFDRIAWTDSSGNQIMKGQLDGQLPVYTPVKERDFFKDFLYNNPNRLPGSDTMLFTIEPVYTWVDGSYRFIIAKKSISKKSFITQMSTLPYSFIQTILPQGYGFCMIDVDGKVLVHSDSSRNLNENFFEEIDDNRAIKGTVKARQTMYIPDSKFYSKEFSVFVSPVKGLPYSLVVFSDNGVSLPVNMRILIFSMVFSLVFIIAYLLFWCFLFFRRLPRRRILFTGFDYLNWLIPRHHYMNIYQVCFLFIMLYMLGILAFTFFTNTYLRDNNHALLILLFQTPVNIPLGIFIISQSFRRKKASAIPLFIIMLAVFHIFYILISFRWLSDIPVSLILFDLLLNLFLFFMHANSGKLKRAIEIPALNYFSWYTLLVESMVISLSVLPASLFSYYAYNQEILQGLKKNQLNMAISVEKRVNGIYGLLSGLGKNIRDGVIDSLKYGKGIYTPSRLEIKLDSFPNPKEYHEPLYERFYFNISDEVSNDYYKSGYLPALRDRARDSSHIWRISPNENSLSFFYGLKPDTGLKKARMLYLDSPFPHRFDFSRDLLKFLMLVVLKFFLLFGLYFLIRQILHEVFLKKYLIYRKHDLSDFGVPYFATYLSRRGLPVPVDQNHAYITKELILDFRPGRKEDELDLAEQRIIENAMKWKEYYELIMSESDPAEKRLLNNLARTGFINYKNEVGIFRLLDKGVLVHSDTKIKIFSLGFRAYILKIYSMENDPAMVKILKGKSPWESFKRPFLIILIAFACLIFFTQQEAWQRISALLTALTSSIPMVLDLFRGFGGRSGKS